MIDEIKILSGEKLPSPPQDGECTPQDPKVVRTRNLTVVAAAPSMPSSLFFEDSETLRKHLSARKNKIVSSLTTLFAKFPPASPEVSSLQQQMSKLLAAEKEHICELRRVGAEKEQMSERLVAATHRYMIAEKKNDRLKSQQVQKLENQNAGSAVTMKEEPSSASNGAEPMNGVSSNLFTEESESDRKQVMVEAARRKEHVEQLEAENKKLTEEVTALNVKLAGLSDDDYAKTDLFKAFKSQHEDVIKRINNLEATNIQLRAEAQKYQAERTAYRMKVDDEARATVTESERAVLQAEAHLTRIRHSRDELLAKIGILEASQKDSEISRQQINDLMSACESRIAALESEIERLRLQTAEQESAEGSAAAEDLTPEQLRSKFDTLNNKYQLVVSELPAMEAAWKKAQALAGKKIAEIATWEENVTRANADKAKADQKFFAAMKAKENLEQQLRVLRAQATKSTEVVAQLKDTDSLSRSMVDKLEKQTAEMRAQMEDLSNQHRQLQHKFNESAITTEGHVSQIAELKKHAETKDAAYLEAKKAKREAEVERDKMAERIEGLESKIEHWKQKSQGNQSEHTSALEVSTTVHHAGKNCTDVDSRCCNARFVRITSRTRLSRRAGTRSATAACRTG